MKRVNITSKRNELVKLLKKYKKFSAFSRNKRDAYRFTEMIGIKVCPYCNINYIYTVYSDKKKPIVRPDIDHFTAKKRGGKELELVNLVPVCNQCNSRIKHMVAFSVKTHLHPYCDDFDELFVFSVISKSINYMDIESFDIKLLPRSNTQISDEIRGLRNICDLKLEQRYQYHKNEVINVFQKANFYNRYRAQEIGGLLGLSGAIDTILRTDCVENDINNISLGKLKQDMHKRFIV